MEKLFALTAFFFVSASFAGNGDSDQLADEAHRHSLELGMGQHQDGSNLSSAALTSSLLFDAEISARYTRLNGSAQNETSASLYIQSDPFAKFTLGAGFETGERAASYAVNDWLFFAGTNLSNWHAEFNFMRGEIETVPALLGPELTAQLREQGYLTADRQGVGASLAYYATNWTLQLAYRDYKLERINEPNRRDIAKLLSEMGIESEADLLSFLSRQVNQERLRRYTTTLGYGNRQYYRQVSHVADQEAGINGSYYVGDASFSTGISWSDNLYFNEQVSSVYGSASYSLNNDTTIGFLLSTADEADSLYGEIQLGFSW